jgi:hypothetical protein
MTSAIGDASHGYISAPTVPFQIVELKLQEEGLCMLLHALKSETHGVFDLQTFYLDRSNQYLLSKEVVTLVSQTSVHLVFSIRSLVEYHVTDGQGTRKRRSRTTGHPTRGSQSGGNDRTISRTNSGGL